MEEYTNSRKRVSGWLFTEGSSHMDWEVRNCENCVKASRYKKSTDSYTHYRCFVQRDIHVQFVAGDEHKPMERSMMCVSKYICPLRQTERKPQKKYVKKEPKEQLELF